MNTMTACPEDKGGKVSETQGPTRSQGRCRAGAEVLPPAPRRTGLPVTLAMMQGLSPCLACSSHGQKAGAQLGTPESSAGKALLSNPSFAPAVSPPFPFAGSPRRGRTCPAGCGLPMSEVASLLQGRRRRRRLLLVGLHVTVQVADQQLRV